MKDLNRYRRQTILPEIGLEGQTKLCKASVVVIGAGGLGSPVLMYLAATGIGKIGIVDFDIVDESNLQRQILFTENDLGKSKAIVAATRLKEMSKEISVQTFNEKLTEFNASKIITEYDILVDCSDNFTTRYLINDTCVELNKPFVSGSVYRFEGQLSVFNYLNGPCYRDLYPEAPMDSASCSEIGVLGVLPGIIGTLQASEVIKMITGAGEVLSGKLLIIDALTLQFTTLKITTNRSSDTKKEKNKINYISKEELKNLDPKGIQLIDVRDEYESEENPFDGINIPLHHLKDNLEKLDSDKKLILFCDKGSRSAIGVKYLISQGFMEVYSLS